MVIDGGVDVVVALSAQALGPPVASVGAPAAAVGDATELLHIDVDQGAWVVMLVAVQAAPARPDHPAGHRIARGQPRGLVTSEHPPDVEAGTPRWWPMNTGPRRDRCRQIRIRVSVHAGVRAG